MRNLLHNLRVKRFNTLARIELARYESMFKIPKRTDMIFLDEVSSIHDDIIKIYPADNDKSVTMYKINLNAVRHILDMDGGTYHICKNRIENAMCLIVQLIKHQIIYKHDPSKLWKVYDNAMATTGSANRYIMNNIIDSIEKVNKIN